MRIGNRCRLGFEEKELGLEVTDHTLTVKGEARTVTEEKEKAFILHETAGAALRAALPAPGGRRYRQARRDVLERATDGATRLCPSLSAAERSQYAELASVPVAVLGLVAYVSLFATALVPTRPAAAAGAAIALAGAAFSAWLLYAHLALTDALCQWCIANDVVIALAAVAAVWRLRQST